MDVVTTPVSIKRFAFHTAHFSRLCWVVLLVLVQVPSGHAEMGTIMSLGLGLGESRTQGDYTQKLDNTVFSMGFDYDYQRGFILINGSSSIKNDFKAMDLIVGFGTRHIKLGTGFLGLQTSIPQDPHNIFDTSGNFTANSGRRISLSVTTIPLYLRLKPILTDNVVLAIDGYYGLLSRGSMTFPFFETRSDQYTYVSSVPKEQGGARGYAVSLTWRLRHKMSAIRLAYQYREAVMEKQTSGIKTDVFGWLGTVTTPEITFQNRTVLLQYVLVK